MGFLCPILVAVFSQSLLFCHIDTDPPGVAVYVPDTSRWVAMLQGDGFSIGKLDAEGNFLPDERWFNIRGGVSGPLPPYSVINPPSCKKVYEFRSGRLIPGQLVERGTFVPDLDGKIIALKDYRPSKDAPPIYNLPGQFVVLPRL